LADVLVMLVLSVVLVDFRNLIREMVGSLCGAFSQLFQTSEY